MAHKDAFNAAKNMSTVVGGFLKQVAGEIGMDKAVALYAAQGKPLGTQLAGAVTKQSRRGKFRLQTLAAVLAQSNRGWGLRCKIKTTADTVTVTAFDCPMYQGLKAAGLDHDTIASLCHAVSAQEHAGLSEAYPQLACSLSFRSAPRKACVEQYVLTK